jgi:hypothetical protein
MVNIQILGIYPLISRIWIGKRGQKNRNLRNKSPGFISHKNQSYTNHSRIGAVLFTILGIYLLIPRIWTGNSVKENPESNEKRFRVLHVVITFYTNHSRTAAVLATILGNLSFDSQNLDWKTP